MRRSRVWLASVVACGAFTLCAPAAHAMSIVSFSSPSTNIGCELFQAEGHWIARCDIRDHDWATPSPPARCHLDYGHGVFVSTSGARAAYVCAGDTALGAKRILGYGDSIRRGSVKCLSLTTGMRCNDVADGHGFLLSREQVKLY